MRKMKDSGIEWIGEIPEGWEVYRDFGVVPKDSRNDNHNVTSLDTSNYKVVDIGDLVINKMKAWQGSMAVSDYRGIVSPAYHVCSITSNKVNKRYLHHLLRNPAYLPEYVRLSTGMRIGQWDLGFDDFKNIPFLIPPFDEQAKIADYLDNGCTSLDSILDKTHSSIEAYKKLKQAVITQAVTKGVRGKREMKDSGVEWISEIPANWTVKRGKQLFSETNERSETGSEELLTVSHITGVTPRSQKNVNMFKSESLVGYKICHNGDLAANTMWMWQGAIGVSKFHGVISPSYNTYRQKTNDYYFEYLDFLLRIRPLIDAYTIHSTGITLSRLRLYPDSFLSLYFIVPPITEQKEIADYLDTKCAEIDRLIAKKEQLVKELESYKKSLIYEVVTGKREV